MFSLLTLAFSYVLEFGVSGIRELGGTSGLYTQIAGKLFWEDLRFERPSTFMFVIAGMLCSLHIVVSVLYICSIPDTRRAAATNCGLDVGGQQQMLAIGRALMGRPKLLMLDEPSLGLAPLVIRELYEAIRRLINTGLTVLLVEQDINLALKAAKRAYVLENGRVVLQGPASELRENAHIKDHYLGL